MRALVINIPHYMDGEQAARELHAYLRGAGESGGPHFDKHTKSEARWQLDDSNDYWLHVDEDGARLTYRYNERRAQAVAALFNETHKEGT